MRARRVVAGIACVAVGGLAVASVDRMPEPAALAATFFGPTQPGAPETVEITPEQQAAIDSYKGFFTGLWAMHGKTHEEIRAMLGPYATAKIVGYMLTWAEDIAADGRAWVGTVVFNEPEAKIDGDEAVVSECRDRSTEQVLDLATGQVLSTGNPNTQFKAQLELESDGQWRLTGFRWVGAAC